MLPSLTLLTKAGNTNANTHRLHQFGQTPLVGRVLQNPTELDGPALKTRCYTTRMQCVASHMVNDPVDTHLKLKHNHGAKSQAEQH